MRISEYVARHPIVNFYRIHNILSVSFKPDIKCLPSRGKFYLPSKYMQPSFLQESISQLLRHTAYGSFDKWENREGFDCICPVRSLLEFRSQDGYYFAV